jgi:hypothetical protein
MANNYQHGGYARITQHDPDSSFNATYKPLWNRIMDNHPSFDNITLSDLLGENSILLFSIFVNCLAANPPVSAHTKKPFSSNTLKSAIGALVDALKRK